MPTVQKHSRSEKMSLSLMETMHGVVDRSPESWKTEKEWWRPKTVQWSKNRQLMVYLRASLARVPDAWPPFCDANHLPGDDYQWLLANPFLRVSVALEVWRCVSVVRESLSNSAFSHEVWIQ